MTTSADRRAGVVLFGLNSLPRLMRALLLVPHFSGRRSVRASGSARATWWQMARRESAPPDDDRTMGQRYVASGGSRHA
ncbi:hypothetical protein OBBRIDRAFT_796108 [Obba rivulosa]|uniref:Uncharacterized protein n=1 Tax=Obba rivulosa TaxID=1052685 RepID=A0A8E2AT83_9APHY|nr:hypothetical protein OBBRIDRAFT_796108 [Obba rivulosa]